MDGDGDDNHVPEVIEVDDEYDEYEYEESEVQDVEAVQQLIQHTLDTYHEEDDNDVSDEEVYLFCTVGNRGSVNTYGNRSLECNLDVAIEEANAHMSLGVEGFTGNEEMRSVSLQINTAIGQGSSIPKDWILLDNQSTADVI